MTITLFVTSLSDRAGSHRPYYSRGLLRTIKSFWLPLKKKNKKQKGPLIVCEKIA